MVEIYNQTNVNQNYDLFHSMKTIQSQSIVKIATLCVLAGTLFFSTSQSARANSNSNNRTFPNPVQPRSEAIDHYTDHFFYTANPELKKRKLRTTDYVYIQEWNVLRKAIAPLIKSDKEVCSTSDPKQSFWEFDLNKNQQSYDYLADVIFYNRNPKLEEKRIRPNILKAQEWSSIRRKMYVSTCGI